MMEVASSFYERNVMYGSEFLKHIFS